VQSVPASREEAEAIVQAWDVDEPDQAGALRVERIEFRTGTANKPAAAFRKPTVPPAASHGAKRGRFGALWKLAGSEVAT
jgi:hypothetical protein